ncbi:hypothetical protein ATM97_00215 [Nocardia sp. MH4]|uniref:hypothetical protein n=1 Tax=unclassified Nocardia TaxID=2637762 RepID=UPI001C4F7DA7|nr:hypothetical protein [Nocardia sp. MH4]MBW0269591.1 hypothetical protein [Nocardia sp. MH4]
MRPAVEAVGAVGAGTDPAPASVPAPPSPPTVPIRPLRFRELLDEPFALIQAHIRALSTLGACALVAAVLGVLGVTGLVSHLTDGSDTGTAWAAILATAAFLWLLRLVLRGATVAIALADFGGVRLGAIAGLRAAARRAGPLLLAQIMFTLTGIGVLLVGSLLIITYPLALLWLSNVRARRFVAEPVIVGEHAGFGAAIARSKELVQGADWTVAGLWLTQRVIFAVLAVPAFGVPFYLSDFSGTHRWAFITLLVGGLLLVVTISEIVEATSRAVCYIDRRCAREGMDIAIPGESR